MKNILKQYLKRNFPEIISAFHNYRNEKQYKKMKFTKLSYGFTLMGTQAMQSETFEPIETKLILENLKNADLFVDIGANIGYFTCLALNNKVNSIAVEPLKDNLNVLFKNIQKNGWSNVEVFPMALSEKPGLLELFGGGTGASLLSGWAGNSDLLKRIVPVSTLDILLGNRFTGLNLFLKIDVEGAEYELLKGALSTIRMTPKPKWLIEICLTDHHPKGVNPNFVNVFKLFWENGYYAKSVGFDDKIITNEDVHRWVEKGICDFGSMNYFFEESN
jgi:FkbM family methyltransferase